MLWSQEWCIKSIWRRIWFSGFKSRHNFLRNTPSKSGIYGILFQKMFWPSRRKNCSTKFCFFQLLTSSYNKNEKDRTFNSLVTSNTSFEKEPMICIKPNLSAMKNDKTFNTLITSNTSLEKEPMICSSKPNLSVINNQEIIMQWNI